MQNVTLGLEEMEISELIRELRIEKKVRQEVLYQGLCTRKKYFQLENGEVVMDELLSERLFSRLHVQYRLVDIMLDEEQFWQKECRHEINIQLRKKCLEKAEELLKEYETKAPQTEIHIQYVQAKRAEIGWRNGKEGTGELFCKALELTMPVSELEKRVENSGVVSEDELWMYFCYRLCEKPLSVEEYIAFLEGVEKWFLSVQIYAEVYFEAAYQLALVLQKAQRFVLCREICQKAILWLKRGGKSFHLPEFYFTDAMAGMRLSHGQEDEKELFQQCKMAYHVGMAFGEKETVEKLKKQCEEEFLWHITD